MRWRMLPLLVGAAVGLSAAPGPPFATTPAQVPAVLVDHWVEAVLAHAPGIVDDSLLAVARTPPATFDFIADRLGATLNRDLPSPEARNDVRRRGALLHTDIALLLPDRAAAFPSSDEVVVSADGVFLDRNTGTGHWALASAILQGVTPRPSSDEFVRLWYRAVAAHFLYDWRFGYGGHHLRRATKVLPHDPILLFYEGAMREAMASPRFQNVRETTPGLISRRLALAPEDVQLDEAERLFREAVLRGAPPEALLRQARVTGIRGKHAVAIALLEQVAVPAGDGRLAYLRELFMGTEQGAAGNVLAARASFERAARLFPTAQAPLVALSELLRRAGDRAAALDALRRLEGLPRTPAERVDPWWDYYRSYAADANAQIAAVRASVNRTAAP